MTLFFEAERCILNLYELNYGKMTIMSDKSFIIENELKEYAELFKKYCPPPLSVKKGTILSRQCAAGGWLYFVLEGVLKTYIEDSLPDEPYDIRVDNQYSLPEDEAEEKQIDLSEVNAQTMSKKSYMKKWRNLTDEEADEELQQIARERELLESSYFNPGDIGTQTEDENIEEGENSPEERTEEEETEEELTEE